MYKKLFAGVVGHDPLLVEVADVDGVYSISEFLWWIADENTRLRLADKVWLSERPVVVGYATVDGVVAGVPDEAIAIDTTFYGDAVYECEGEIYEPYYMQVV